jgi:predicted NACHT family NTPase
VLALERRLVILGPPGSGKSTLAACLALTLVTDEVTLDTGLPAETVPILVPLKTYAASLKERSNLRLDAFLEEQVGRQLPDLGAILSDGRALVFFDGLDEVFDEVHRRWVSAEVSRLISLHPQARFLLTSRPYGYQAAPLTGAVPLFEMVAFDDDRIRRFFRRWFAALAREGHEGTPELRADALADEVLGRPRIRSLAENPMLCTLIVLIHHSGIGASSGTASEVLRGGGRRPDGTLGESQALAQAGGAFRLSRAGADGWRPGRSGVEGADGIGRTGDPGRRSRVVDRGCPGR